MPAELAAQVADRRNEGNPTLRSYYQTSFVKQYEKADRLLRTETCVNERRSSAACQPRCTFGVDYIVPTE